MPDSYAEMDTWTSDEVASFKEAARDRELESQARVFRSFAGGIDAMANAPEALVAEGDSWFAYLPGTDVLDCLRHNHGYIIHSLAHAGDSLENMIYGTRITRSFERATPTITRVLERLGKVKPRCFLFSGGGNDIAGDEFESYLNHAGSGLPALRAEVLATIIDVVFRKYFEDLIDKVSAVSSATNILVHGYGHTVPTGRGVDIFSFTFSGPWLRPALARKGLFDPIVQRQSIRTVIDRYNEMLSRLDQEHPTFHHVDLRNIVDPDQDWANELHLRNSAYARVADRFHETISTV